MIGPRDHAARNVDRIDPLLSEILTDSMAPRAAEANHEHGLCVAELVDVIRHCPQRNQRCLRNVTGLVFVNLADVDQLGAKCESALQLFDIGFCDCHRSTLPGQIVDGVDIDQVLCGDDYIEYCQILEGVE